MVDIGRLQVGDCVESRPVTTSYNNAESPKHRRFAAAKLALQTYLQHSFQTTEKKEEERKRNQGKRPKGRKRTEEDKMLGKHSRERRTKHDISNIRTKIVSNPS